MKKKLLMKVWYMLQKLPLKILNDRDGKEAVDKGVVDVTEVTYENTE